MKKISTLLMSFCMCAGMAWGQKLVTSVEAGKYYTLECNSTQAHNTARFLGENALGLDGQSAKPTYLVFEETTGGYYVKSSLTGKYLNQGEVIAEGTKYTVDYSETAVTVWTVGKLSDDATDVYLTIGDTKFYLNNNYDGAQHLQIVKHNPIGTGNACSLWEMREHEDGYKVIKSKGTNITNLNQLTDGCYVAFYNVGRQKFIYEGTHDHKLYMGTAATEGAGHEYIFRVRKEGDKYAFMAVSGRYISTPLDGNDVFTCGIDNAAKDEFTIAAHGEDHTKWLVKSSNSNIWWDAQDARFVGWKGNGTNSRYEIIPVEVENLEHALADYITVDENIVKWVNIKNVRSGKYATYEGESTKMSLKSDKGWSKAFFYLTGTLGTDMSTVKIYNYATANLCAETNSWTAAGTNWNIIASQGQNIHPGLAITKNDNLNGGDAWNNEGGAGNAIAYWNGNDQGSTWEFESGDFYTLYAKIEALKSELRTVVDAAQTSYEEGNVALNPVTLSATEGEDGYLYSNAAGADNSYAGDNLGVGALIDGKDDTFMHSNYVSNSADGLDHYIRVDMGEGKTLDYFTFGYRVRVDQGGHNAPKTIVVSGSNDNDKYYEITTLTNIPGSTGSVYASEPMGGKPYRYLRFMVTETQGNSKNHEHPFFALASFNLNKVTVKDGSAVKTLVYNTLSNTIEEAEALLGSFRGTEDEINALKNLLPTVVAGLEVHEYPFKLTMNINDPICYHIKSARSKEWNGSYYWTFKDGKVTTITDNPDYAKDVEAYWFFMENPQNGQLQLVPFIEHLKPMGYTTVGDGNDKLTNNASASGFVGTAYTFVENVSSAYEGYPYALIPLGFDNYVSNCNGKDGEFMGFWNDVDDHGTRFALEETAITPSSYLRDLRTALASTPNVNESLVKDAPGYYNVESYQVYKSVMDNARKVYNDATSSDEVCYEQLVIFDNNPQTILTINLPEAGKFYRIKNYAGNGYLNAGTGTGRTQFVADVADAASSVFYLDGDKLVSYTTGLYLGLGGDGSKFVHYTETVGADAGTTFKFSASPEVGKLLIAFKDNERGFYSNGVGNSDAASAGSSGNEYRFTVEEVTWLPIPVNKTAGYTTLYSPVELELSYNRFKAYTVSAISETSATLVKQTVVPAGVGVVLELQDDAEIQDNCVYLRIKATETTDVTSVLLGTYADEYVTEDAYALGLIDGVVAFYTAKKNFNDANQKVEEDGVKWLNNGFKAYLPKTTEAKTLRFNFGGETTAIESVFSGVDANAPIYDLSGRRVVNAVKGGIYIQNGKKFIVK